MIVIALCAECNTDQQLTTYGAFTKHKHKCDTHCYGSYTHPKAGTERVIGDEQRLVFELQAAIDAGKVEPESLARAKRTIEQLRGRG